MSYETILYDVKNRIATITLNRPEQMNTWNDTVATDVYDAMQAAGADRGVRVIVFTGAGKAFCAGADLSALSAAAEDRLRQLYDGFLAVADCTLPTVAAVNGPAVGAGLNLALACDVRIAGPAALFDARFQKLGIHPGGGMTWMLQRAVGPQLARAALLFGMRFDADAAVSHGLALEVADDPVAAARELAAGPASAPREVVIATKATMRATSSPGSVDTELHAAALRAELGPQATSIQAPAFAERLAMARRK
jgi:enoyl-CoA hydratase